MASHGPLEKRNTVRKRLEFDDITPTNSSATDLGVAPLANTTPGASAPPENQDSKEIKIIDFSNLTEQEKYQKMEQWNFDFHNEVPLEGKWEWERVEPPKIVDHKEKICALGQKDACGDRTI